ncbi:MAG: pilin [Patescibacteria group bacterium]|nr:pilin [Patescibacteria group bacterium]
MKFKNWSSLKGLILIIVFFLLFIASVKQSKAINISVTSNPPANSVITTDTEVSVTVTLTREESELGLLDSALTYRLGLLQNPNIIILDQYPDCAPRPGTVACMDRTLGLNGMNYDPLFRFRLNNTVAPGTNITIVLRFITQDPNNAAVERTTDIPLNFVVSQTRPSCETNPANGNARCFMGSSCNTPPYTVRLTGANAQCGTSQVCCQRPPDEEYDCDQTNITRITCQQFKACSRPGTEVKCAASCEYGFQVAPVAGRGCATGLRCCFREPVPNNGCESNYGSYPYSAECRPYCSGDKPFLVNTALLPGATCPGKDGMPQACCTATNLIDNRLPKELCVYGNYPDGREKLGILVPFGRGCIPALADITDLSTFILYWGGGIAGFVSLLLISYSGFLIMTSKGDAEKFQAGKELLSATIIGLIFLTFSAFLLRLIISDILGIIR